MQNPNHIQKPDLDQKRSSEEHIVLYMKPNGPFDFIATPKYVYFANVIIINLPVNIIIIFSTVWHRL